MKDLLKLKNVNAVGVSTKRIQGKDTGEPCVTVFVTRKQKNPIDKVPKTVQGMKTDVVSLPPAKAMYSAHRFKRPFMGGDEIGTLGQRHEGTLGMIFRGRLENDYCDFGLTNWHVVAGSGFSAIGQAITQPANSEFVFGGVVRQAAPNFRGGTSRIDAALIKLSNNGGNSDRKGWASGARWDKIIDRCNNNEVPGMEFIQGVMVGYPHYHANFNGLIRDRGPKDWSGHTATPAGFGVVQLGDKVFKSGRSTNVTHGTVRAVDLAIAVDYGSLGEAIFTNQILVTQEPEDREKNKGPSGIARIIMGGDSGSVLIDRQHYATGLVYAGAPTYLVATPIQDVLQGLFTEWELSIYNINREALKE